jgi:hypothetical protein
MHICTKKAREISISEMVTTKKRAYGKEIQFNSIIFLAHLDTKRKDKGGLNHVIKVTRSFVQRTATFAAFTLLVEIIQRKKIPIQYLL